MNLDGFYLGVLGRCGIEGVFRDSKDMVLLQFGEEVWVDLVVHAEDMALWEGLLVAVASRWPGFVSFIPTRIGL